MMSTIPTFEEYRALSPEERELIRLGDALAFARGEIEPAVVKRSRRKSLVIRGGHGSTLSKAQLVAVIAESADLDLERAERALDALTDIISRQRGVHRPVVGERAASPLQRNAMEALVEANKAAAAGYQDLFKRQVAIFEETMGEAQKQLKSFDAIRTIDDRTKAQAELARAAFEKALGNMQALAESAQKANAEAYEMVSARIKQSIGELRDFEGWSGRG